MIPALAHFVWFGREFPWLNVLAVKSACVYGGFEQVRVHHEHELPDAVRSELGRLPRVELLPLRAAAVFEATAPWLGPAMAGALQRRYEGLSRPAARSNVMRVALLLAGGGVYLDFDTVTVKNLSALRRNTVFFCGNERVAFPASGSRMRGALLASVRAALSRVPAGYRAFRKIERRYPLAANNAVLGAVQGHPFVVELARRMAALPEADVPRRFALGTHLLQDALGEQGGQGITVLPPAAFYPLGPVMSQHWFSYTTAPEVDDVVGSETLVVHWYASLLSSRRQRAMDARFLRQHRHVQRFSALVDRLALL